MVPIDSAHEDKVLDLFGDIGASLPSPIHFQSLTKDQDLRDVFALPFFPPCTLPPYSQCLVCDQMFRAEDEFFVVESSSGDRLVHRVQPGSRFPLQFPRFVLSF